MTQTSDDLGSRVFVWTWLPGSVEPVVAGSTERRGRDGLMRFIYGRSYLSRPNAMSLYGPELPLREWWIEPTPGLTMPGCLRDGAPDGWGRRVVDARLGVDEDSLSEEGYMLESGSNRFGANDFQTSPTDYVARQDTATLDELVDAVELLREGRPLSPSVKAALVGGTSIGGARPKVLISDDDEVQWIAKLSTPGEVFSVVNAEATALELARRVGLDAVESEVTHSMGREVLLVRRFDRDTQGRRRHVVSGLTMAGEDENGARYVTYPTLLDMLHEYAPEPERVGRDLFERIVFNIAISNSDDHARNHAAFWDGNHLALTPAYDLAPGPRSGDSSEQALSIDRKGNRRSDFATCLAFAHIYGLTDDIAREVIDNVVETIRENWDEAADLGRLTAADRAHLKDRQFLHRAAFYDYTSVTAQGVDLQSVSDIEIGPGEPQTPPGRRRGKTTPGSTPGSYTTAERAEGPGL